MTLSCGEALVTAQSNALVVDAAIVAPAPDGLIRVQLPAISRLIPVPDSMPGVLTTRPEVVVVPTTASAVYGDDEATPTKPFLSTTKLCPVEEPTINAHEPPIVLTESAAKGVVELIPTFAVAEPITTPVAVVVPKLSKPPPAVSRPYPATTVMLSLVANVLEAFIAPPTVKVLEAYKCAPVLMLRATVEAAFAARALIRSPARITKT